MKQKKFLTVLATAALVAAGFTSCSVSDNPSFASLPDVADNFDEGSLIKNGSCQGSFAGNYWCHEWRTADAQFDGEAKITFDPAAPTNRCVAVVVRSEEEGRAAGNLVEADGKIAGWDSQFFITLGESQTLKTGDKLRLTMKVKADIDQSGIDTQSHAAPGAYLHYTAVGNVNFTTEWKEFDSGEIEVLADPNWTGGIKNGSYTIAFNLSKGAHYTAYFDDIKVQVLRKDAFDEGSLIVNGRCESFAWPVKNYWCHEWRTADAQFDGAAKIIVDPTDPSNHCAAVVVRSVDEARAAGNAITTNGQALADDNSNFADWDSQFFITWDEANAPKAGDKIQLKMKVRADEPQTAGTQSHFAPGAYKHWYCVGDVNFTTEWTDFVSSEVEVASGDPGWGKAAEGMYSIAFNLAKGGHNTVYFDDIQVFVKKAE